VRARLPPALGRASALAILALVLGFVYLAAVAPVIDAFAETRAETAEAQALLARYRQAGQRLPAQRALLDRLARQQEAQNGFLDGASETLAAAELQSRIKAIVESARGELRSNQILPVQQEGRFARVAVRGDMSMTLPAAQRVLYALETASPLLFLDNVDIHSHAADRQQDRNEDIVVLEMTLDIYGYMRAAK
jgi:general secretion pathway protein M